MQLFHRECTIVLSSEQTTTALQLLANKAAERAAEIEKYSLSELRGSTDEDNDSSSPVYYSLYNNSGNRNLRGITNSTSVKIEKIYGFRVEYLN